MSLFADYKMEREGKFVYEDEFGFAVYSFKDDYCYIEDIYVEPMRRKESLASEMADLISLIAKDRGCKKLMGSVVPSVRGSTESLSVLIRYGFKLKSSLVDFIIFEKEI